MMFSTLLRNAMEFIISSVLSFIPFYVLFRVISNLDLEQTLRRAILLLVSALALLLKSSIGELNVVSFIASCLTFHSVVGAIMCVRWPEDNIYFHLKRPGVDLRTKLIISCSSTPFILIHGILIRAAVRKITMAFHSLVVTTLSILGTLLRCVTLLVLGPPRLLRAFLKHICYRVLLPSLQTANQLFLWISTAVSGCIGLFSAGLGAFSGAFRYAFRLVRAWTLSTLHAGKSVSASVTIWVNQHRLVLLAFLSEAKEVIGSGLSFLGKRAASALLKALGNVRHAFGSLLFHLQRTNHYFQRVASSVLAFTLVAISYSVQKAISVLRFFYSATRFLLGLGYTVAAASFSCPSEKEIRITIHRKLLSSLKWFGKIFTVTLGVLVVYLAALTLVRHYIKKKEKDALLRQKPICQGRPIGKKRDELVQRSQDRHAVGSRVEQVDVITAEKHRDDGSLKFQETSGSISRQDGNSSQLSPATEHSLDDGRKSDPNAYAAVDARQAFKASLVQFPCKADYYVAVQCAAVSAANRGVSRDLERSAEERCSHLIKKSDVASQTVKSPPEMQNNENNDVMLQFSIAAHCAAAIAPKFVACEELRRKANEVRRTYETQSRTLEAKINVLEEGASGMLLGNEDLSERDDERHLRLSSFYCLSRGLEAARSRMVLSEADVQEAARYRAADRARDVCEFLKTDESRSIYGKLYNDDIDLVDFLDLEPSLASPLPLLLPSYADREVLEQGLGSMDFGGKIADSDHDLDTDGVDQEIDDDLGRVPQSPTLNARRAVLQVRFSQREEKRAASMAIRRELLREGMKVLKEDDWSL